MAKERAVAEEQQTDPLAWMATFSDLVTLLLTFFVLLISMSSMDSRALKQTFGFFDDAMGPLDKVAATEIHNESPSPIQAVIANQIIRRLGNSRRVSQAPRLVAQALDRVIDKNDLEDVLEARMLPEGLVLSVAAGVLFSEDGTRLRPEAALVLAAVADLLLEPNIRGEIQGRQLSAGSGYDPWRLAGERALLVNDYLQRAGVPADKLAVAAYGPGWTDDTLPGQPAKINFVLTWQGFGHDQEKE